MVRKKKCAGSPCTQLSRNWASTPGSLDWILLFLAQIFNNIPKYQKCARWSGKKIARDPPVPNSRETGPRRQVVLTGFCYSLLQFSTTTEPVNPHFEATLQCFLRLLSMFLQRYFNLCASVFKGSAGFAKRIQYII